MLRPLKPIPLVGVGAPEGSDDYMEVTLDKEKWDVVISTILAKKINKFINTIVDDLVPIPKESEVIFDSDLECDMHVTTPLPTTNVREENFDINSPLGEQVVDFLMENVDVAGLPRHLYNPLFDEEFEDISSLDLPELTPVIDEPTLPDTLPLPCTNVLGDVIEDIDLLLGEHLDTLSTADREIDFNPHRGIEELKRLLVDNPVPVPRVFDEPLGNSDSMSRSYETSDLIMKELTIKIGLDDLIPTEIDDGHYDSEEGILFLEHLLIEETLSDPTPVVLPKKSTLLVTPPLLLSNLA
nr:hypothetical protein [Tanacetum cinerariifolium]